MDFWENICSFRLELPSSVNQVKIEKFCKTVPKLNADEKNSVLSISAFLRKLWPTSVFFPIEIV